MARFVGKRNSTVALDPNTGELAWYFQHLPGDDWDQDYTNERVLIRTAVNPNPKFAKWINPDVKPNEHRNLFVNVGEGGGLFAIDRDTGQFLWATPFPYDTPERRFGVPRPGSDAAKFGGLAKVNMTTGEIQRIYEGRAPGIAAFANGVYVFALP